MKLARHSAILRLVREQRIGSQDALRAALALEGIEVAQATLSRDIRELGLHKQRDPGGGFFYLVPAGPPAAPDLALVLETWVLGLDGVGPMLVLRTRPGGAGAVAAAVEQAGWPELLAALPGGTSVVLVARDEPARRKLERRIGITPV